MDGKYTGEKVLLRDLSSTRTINLAVIYLDCEFVNGEVTVVISEQPLPMPGINLLIGNELAGTLMYPEIRVVDNPLSYNFELPDQTTYTFPACAITRSQKLKG